MELCIVTTYADEFDKYETAYYAFLRQVELETKRTTAIANMGDETSGGFLHIVRTHQRWNKENGQIALLMDNTIGSIVGISAVETSTLNTNYGSGGNRCWLLPRYRQNNAVSNYLLASNLQWCTDNQKQGMILTFNDYNKWIYDAISKLSSGKGAALGTVWSDWWNDCIPLPRKVRLHNTPQWAVIKPIVKSTVVQADALTLDQRFGVRDKPFIIS
jgi:hypothetical protein